MSTNINTSSTILCRLLRSLQTLPTPLQRTVLQHHSRTQQHTARAFLSTSRSSQSSRSSGPLVSLFRNSCRRRHASTSTSTNAQPRSSTASAEPLVPAPTASSGPLLTRLPNRALPEVSTGLSPTARLWLKTLPIFIALITLSSLSIFNYQKSSSSTVNSILYALRTSPAVREVLGDEIYFRSRVPWISGELNQLHGNIDISFWVKGTRGTGKVRFVSVRRRRDGYFETLEWSLTDEKGETVQLLEVEGARDPNAMSGRKIVEEEILNV